MNVSGRHIKPEAWLLLLAAVLLGLGVAVYVFDRGAVAWFLPSSLAGQSGSGVLAPLSAFLPTLVHPLAMILITAAVLRPWPRSLAYNCAGWFTIECLFEIGQMAPFDGRIAAALPGWFQRVPVLDVTGSYFVSGTYDPWDILSIGIGTTVAYLIVSKTSLGEKR